MARRGTDIGKKNGPTRSGVRVAAVAALAVLPAACGGATETATVTEPPRVPDALPPAVAETHAELLVAAESGDYERLRPLIGRPFTYTHAAGGGGAIAYWRKLERDGGERPIAILRDLLRLPHALDGGVYVWPFAVAKQPEELTPAQRRLLGSVGGENLSDDFGSGSGYLGWRAGIDPDGEWVFFVAGD